MVDDKMRPMIAISRFALMLGLVALFGTACIKKRTTPVAPDAPAVTKPVEPKAPLPSEEAANSSVVDSPLIASVPIELEEAKLKKHVTYTDALRYRFSYGERKVEDDIKFEAGKALITIKKLRSGITADLTLEVVEGGVVRLRGVAKNLKLEPKENRIPLTLSPINGEGGELSINIEIPVDPSTNPSVDPVDPIAEPGEGGGDTLIGEGIGPGTGSPAFESEIRPIFARHCAECHHPGGQAPDLTAPPSNADVAEILIQIETKKMPPAPRDGVSEQDVVKIKAWKKSLD